MLSVPWIEKLAQSPLSIWQIEEKLLDFHDILSVMDMIRMYILLW